MPDEQTQHTVSIRGERQRRGMTRAELSALAQISFTTIAHAEAYGLMSDRTRGRIANILGCAPEELRP